MGMVMSFTRVTPEELDRAVQDPTWADKLMDFLDEIDTSNEPNGYIGKAWAGIDFLLEAASVPLSLQDDGHPMRDDNTRSGWNVDAVANAAKLLKAAPFEQLAEHFDPAVMTEEEIYPTSWDAEDLEFLAEEYATLVKFFQAADGSAAIMELG